MHNYEEDELGEGMKEEGTAGRLGGRVWCLLQERGGRGGTTQGVDREHADQRNHISYRCVPARRRTSRLLHHARAAHRASSV
jgi:hypothetical protein